MDIKAERHKLGQIYQRALEIRSAAEKENRDMTPEEEQRFDAAMDEFDSLKDKIESEEKRQKRVKDAEGWANRSQNDPPRNDPNRDGENRDNPRATEEYRASFERFLRGGRDALTGEELRAMQADSAVGGGYLVTPQQFVAELLQDVDNMVVIRQLARGFQLTQAESLGV
ncbi:MAG: phage major capsid protein, partial [Syntrophomonadaceae bacterium]